MDQKWTYEVSGARNDADSENVIKEIKVDNPYNLEVTFASLRPKSEFSPKFNIIVCELYSPPRSRKKAKLIDHITQTYHELKLKFPSAFFLLGGDVNCLDTSQLLNISRNFKQMVKKPTRQSKILSVIITDLHTYYQDPYIIPPLKPDVEGLGKPSDHSVPVAMPYTDTSKPRKREFVMKVVRPMPESKIKTLGQWITTESFEDVSSVESPSEKVKALGNLITEKVNQVCPEKSIKVYKNDREWMTEPLRKLRRRKSREYRRHGKSDRFLKLQTVFKEMKEPNTKNTWMKKSRHSKNAILPSSTGKSKLSDQDWMNVSHPPSHSPCLMKVESQQVK